MKNSTVALLITLFVISACSNNDDNTNDCDFSTVISAEQFKNAPNDHLTINSLEIEDGCLKINFSSSGCSGDSWKLKLIDSNIILKTDSPQRNLRLSLKNEELCEAYITKEMTFDISNIQVNGNQVLLNIENSDDQILYKY